MVGVSEQGRRVETMIGRVSVRAGVGRREARTMLHKFVCGGRCDWYRTKSRKAGFDRHDLTGEQRALIEGTIREVMKDLAMEDARARIHEVLCPGE